MECSVVFEAARRLCAAAGLTMDASECVPLDGGRNNRVYRVETDAGPALMKRYFRGGDWDRLAAESRFLRFCAAAGVRGVPRLLAQDEAGGEALHSWLDGERLDPARIGADDVAAAAGFLGALAGASRDVDIAGMPPARDACLCPDDFFRSPRERVGELERVLPGAPAGSVRERARVWVGDVLRPGWERAELDVREEMADKGVSPVLSPDASIVSPSDFGFHNALRSGRGAAFVDFEYAGRDDAAKAIGDFVCQPDFPPPPGTLEALASGVHAGAAEGGALAERVRILLPLFRIKFCCIILNDFKTPDARRRDFALGGVDRLETQFAKARRYFENWEAQP